jgi:hypothetical protein
MAISNPTSFRAEARYQRACASCGKSGGFHAHHVVSKRLLRLLGRPLWDTRNALRLCEQCHMAVEWGGVRRLRIPVERLPDEAICYIYEVLGPATKRLEPTYLRLESDQRLIRHYTGGCALCQ